LKNKIKLTGDIEDKLIGKRLKNVSEELEGIMNIVDKVISLGINSINLNYDFEGFHSYAKTKVH
jgi:hypothetical protein